MGRKDVMEQMDGENSAMKLYEFTSKCTASQTFLTSYISTFVFKQPHLKYSTIEISKYLTNIYY